MVPVDDAGALDCPSCRRNTPPDSRFCPWCGSALSGSTLRFVAPAAAAPSAGRTSRALAALCAVAVGLGAIAIFGALGLWWAEAVLVPATFLVAYAWWDPMVERFEGPVERFGRRGVVNMWSSARLARAVVGGWTRKGRARVRVRAHQLHIRRQHERALQLLGRAVYSGDHRRVARAKVLAMQTGEQLEQFEHELRRAHEDADRRLEEERRATDDTAQFDPRQLVRSARGRGEDDATFG
jgi:hypothetical protein